MRSLSLLVLASLLLSGCSEAAEPPEEDHTDATASPTTPSPPDVPATAPAPGSSTERVEGTITQVGFDMPNETGAVIVPGCGSVGLPSTELDFTVPENTSRLEFVLTWDLPGEMLFLDVTPPDDSTLVLRDDQSALTSQRIQKTVDSPLPGRWNANPCPLGATTELPFVLEVTLWRDPNDAP